MFVGGTALTVVGYWNSFHVTFPVSSFLSLSGFLGLSFTLHLNVSWSLIYSHFCSLVQEHWSFFFLFSDTANLKIYFCWIFSALHHLGFCPLEFLFCLQLLVYIIQQSCIASFLSSFTLWIQLPSLIKSQSIIVCQFCFVVSFRLENSVYVLLVCSLKC